MVREPRISFGPWTAWAERNQVRDAHLPGVYLLAHWETSPPAQVDPLSQAIIYIGEIADGSLMGRWQQFHRAAFQGKPGHSGGLIYRDTFGDEGESLYVAAFVPQGLSRDLRTLFIRYAAHKLVWDWARQWGGAPICNSRLS